MAERKCEVCGASDADNRGRPLDALGRGVEMRSWTGSLGRWRVRCGKHKLASQR